MKHPNAYFSTLINMFDTYPGLFRIWCGVRLWYCVSEPKHFQILLPVCLKREPIYENGKDIVGEGLLLAPANSAADIHLDHFSPPPNRLATSAPATPSFRAVFSDDENIEKAEQPTQEYQLEKKRIEEELNLEKSKEILHNISEWRMSMYSCIDSIQFRRLSPSSAWKFSSRCCTNLQAFWESVLAQAPSVFSIVRFCSIGLLSLFVDFQSEQPILLSLDSSLRLMGIIIIKAIFSSGHITPLFNLLPLGREYTEIVGKMHDFSGKIVKQKRIDFEEKIRKRRIAPAEDSDEDTMKKKIFLDYLLEVIHKEKTDFTDEQLFDEVNMFIIADKMYDEILGVLGPDRDIEPSDLPQLKYTERFIKETLRFFPVTPFLLRAIDKDIDIGDHVLLAGTSVAFCVLKAHMNDKYWPNPSKFDPNRFLPEEIEQRHPCSYLPFSYGPRNCIGIKYAMMAMQSLISSIVRKYRIFTPYQNIEDIELKFNLVLKPKNGYKISLQLRNGDD
ncbi:hypothetical protein JTB14_018588 [Gonioctena quinquepunctata]|nr:hypothetical protein JTB14_018588 [Gonioctena quinquepunctata]